MGSVRGMAQVIGHLLNKYIYMDFRYKTILPT
jgi:hypothetical protein